MSKFNESFRSGGEVFFDYYTFYKAKDSILNLNLFCPIQCRLNPVVLATLNFRHKLVF